MNLAKFPRRRYTEGKTPLEKLSRLSEHLGGPTVYMKRDDLLGLTGGGNKTRKLEFLIADALSKNADTIITCGSIQSNHCRLTLAASIKEGLECRLILEEQALSSYSPQANGNTFLFQLMGAAQTKVVPHGSDITGEMESVAKEVRAWGRNPYIIPVGGSNEIGATGYAACAQEILEQTFNQGINLNCVITTSGSAGTHAGLLTGFYGLNSNIPVIGINVMRKKDLQEEMIFKLAEKTAQHLGIKYPVPKESVICFDKYLGPGYSIPTEEMIEAVKLLASTEGVLLDPVYTGKAMAGLIDLIRRGYFKKEDNVLFVHTGGSPTLYACTSIFEDHNAIK